MSDFEPDRINLLEATLRNLREENEELRRGNWEVETAQAIDIVTLRTQLADAVTTLEWYASNDNWVKHTRIPGEHFRLVCGSDLSPVSSPNRPVGGKRARQCLQRIKEQKEEK